MGDFEIYASPLDVEADAAWERGLAQDVAAVLRAPGVTRNGEIYHVGIAHAAANVTLLPPGGEWVWPVFENHPLVIDTHFRAECPDWKNSEELARYVFRRLGGLSKYELLLVHDLEEYVDANFDFPERRGMSGYPAD
ncbi:hypothetical protein [Streptomyces sp. KR55]|uniref:hypothetical protein n=1 Tax=Streptomyces sp. KR55 TaxID=3457425 RepID=UPI003FCF28D8